MVLKNIQYAFLCLICNIFVLRGNILYAYCYTQEMKENYQFTAQILGKKFRENQQKYLHQVFVTVYKLVFFLTNKILI